MLRKVILFPVLLLAALGSPHPIARASEMSLERAVVVVDVAEASYVHYTVNELRQQIKGITGRAPVLSYDLKEAKQAPGVLIVVGRAMANELAQRDAGVPQITDQEPGAQGFVLKSVRVAENTGVVLAAGSDSTGTNYAVMELRQLLTESASGLGVVASLDLREKPKCKVRGLYLHQHWRFNHPYATWTWSVEDWKHAMDMAAYLRVNLVMLWPHMDMLSAPLSIPEQDYLTDFREVVDYAHRKRGLEIWMVETSNGTLDDPGAKRLPLDRRDFYAYEHSDGKTKDGRIYGPGSGLKNPGDPKGLAALMANREQLYRYIPNADGYGLIDADPGGWPGSPSSAFVDLFVGNRKLLDRYHEHPQRAKLFYWMLFSWGTGTREENFRNTLGDFAKRVNGPWELLYPPDLKILTNPGYLDRAIVFPYGQVETEPTLPLTSVNFHGLEQALQTVAENKPPMGVMVNVQTFLLQLPNVFFVANSLWSDTQKSTHAAVLESLARRLFPAQAQTLAEGWAQLTSPGANAALAAAERVEALLKRDPRLRVGTLGSCIFPEPPQVLRDLATMLRIHASAEEVRERLTGASEEAAAQVMVRYFREILDWQKKSGFFGTYGVNKQVIFDNFIHGPDAVTVKTAWEQYTGHRTEKEKLQSKIVGLLSTKGYEDWIVNSLTGQVFGTYQVNWGTMDIP